MSCTRLNLPEILIIFRIVYKVNHRSKIIIIILRSSQRKCALKFNKKLVLPNKKRWVDCEAVRRRSSRGIISFNARGHVFSHGPGPSHHNYSCFIKVYPVHAWNYSYSITGFEALSEAMGTVVFVWTCPCRYMYAHPVYKLTTIQLEPQEYSFISVS